MDNGHSFDSILFYGNEQLLFQIEILLFLCIVVITGNFLFSLLFLGIAYQVKAIDECKKESKDFLIDNIQIFSPISDTKTCNAYIC